MGIYNSYTNFPMTEHDSNAPIIFRNEQRKAIDKARNHFQGKNGKKFLWNAKMRFGKTLSALQLVKELDVKRTLIVTHRPVVDVNFREDFDKIFKDEGDSWIYASRFDNGGTGEIASLEKQLEEDSSKHYVFFASMQYLCLSDLVNSNPTADSNPLKHLILKNEWDLVVVDEAHEATTGDTQGAEVIKFLSGKKANVLHLSGTPFNVLDNFTESEIFTWDYIQEQARKEELKELGISDSENPYATLPKMKIFSYDLSKMIGGNKIGEDAEFTFKEFFRTWSGNPKRDKAEMPAGCKGRFVHEEDVKKFLDLLCSEKGANNYPFSTEEYQENFRHTFWVVPGVTEARALSQLLKEHEIFGGNPFKIVNVAGKGDSDEQRSDALDAVEKAMGEDPNQTATITISCGRLTTGVTVKPWTAVLYLKGSDTTSAATYMQTIFRVQSAHIDRINQKYKNECYVFDFAPSRTVMAVTEICNKLKKGTISKPRDFKEFLNFCPVISMSDSEMKEIDAEEFFREFRSISKGVQKIPYSEIAERFPALLNPIDSALAQDNPKIFAIGPDGNVYADRIVTNLYKKVLKAFDPMDIRNLGICYNGDNIISSDIELISNKGRSKDTQQMDKEPYFQDDKGTNYYLCVNYATPSKFTALTRINFELNGGFKIFFVPGHKEIDRINNISIQEI